ncbi:MAG: DDE-type integrase/transposase/recombinase [Spirochaetes bacterium]|nr:DDE-type integrase/transposase/recombinase [Spirochaetota bacterium]MBN2771242.1 DDE-type integrase/transposase/recombinase [Spirochaetota bacterium]
MKQKKRLNRNLLEVSTYFHEYEQCQTRKQRGDLIREISTLYGVNRSTVSRWFKEFKKGSLQKRRKDFRVPRVGLSEQELYCYVQKVSALKWDSMTKTGKVIETSEAVRVLYNAGELPEILPSSTINRWLRNFGLSIEAIKHYKASTQNRLIAKHPNHWWMVDGSVSEIYYLNDKDRLVGDQKISYDKNHASEILTKKGFRKVIIYCAVDLFSSAYYVRGYVAPSENTMHWLAFLMDAFSKKEDSHLFPFRGIPQNIYSDKGSGLNSQQAKMFFESLGINFQYHLPGNSKAKGKVESRIGKYKSQIEAMFRFHKPKSIEEYNYYCYRATVNDNLKKGFVSKWLHIQKTDALVEFDSEKRNLVGYKMFERKVNVYGCVELDKQSYYVSTRLHGEYVIVYHKNDGTMTAVDANDMHYELTGIEHQNIEMGTYRAQKKTEYDRQLEGVEEEGKRIRNVIKPEHFLGETPQISAIQKSGKEAEIQSPFIRQGYKTIREAWTKIIVTTRTAKSKYPKDLVETIDAVFSGMIAEHGEIPANEFDDILEHCINTSASIDIPQEEKNYG